MMSSNIHLAEGSSIQGCLIVRLDASDYIVSADNNCAIESCIMLIDMPSLWQWTKLWWNSLRPLRRVSQPDATAAIFVHPLNAITAGTRSAET